MKAYKLDSLIKKQISFALKKADKDAKWLSFAKRKGDAWIIGSKKPTNEQFVLLNRIVENTYKSLNEKTIKSIIAERLSILVNTKD